MHAPSRPASAAKPAILSGLRAIADGYDALFCDVWGVLHDGCSARSGAVEALRNFRAARGPVILLSNAPRPAADVEGQFARLRVPADCYDAILTSGMLARDDLARRANGHDLRMFHIGPERDGGVFAGLSVCCVNEAEAEIVLCTGLFDDDAETPDAYRAQLCKLKDRNLTLLCANPDMVVQRGGRLVYCAGALARLYEELGGVSVYFGKPYRPIYDAALARARTLVRRGNPRVLVVGDALETDIRGANEAGLDALFIAEGIHVEEMREMNCDAIGALFARANVRAQGVMRELVW